MDRIENVQEYHDVVARSSLIIMDALVSQDGKATDRRAKPLVLFNIRQAYILFRHDDDDISMKLKMPLSKNKHIPEVEEQLVKELDEMGLADMEVDKLLAIMFSFQARAGIKPVQSFKLKAKTYEMERDSL